MGSVFELVLYRILAYIGYIVAQALKRRIRLFDRDKVIVDKRNQEGKDGMV